MLAFAGGGVRAMYKEFYGLREYPFNMTPDPAFLFLSRHHRVALDVLLYGIRERKGFIAITGEVGAGKTTLCRALLNSLDSKTKTALILNPSLSDSQVLKAITDEFRLQPAKTTKKDLYDTINGFLLRELAANHNVGVIVDEAQNLQASERVKNRIGCCRAAWRRRRRNCCRSCWWASRNWPRYWSATVCDNSSNAFHCVITSRRCLPEEIGEYIEHRLRVAEAAMDGSNGRPKR